jgi:hypothetical protein
MVLIDHPTKMPIGAADDFGHLHEGLERLVNERETCVVHLVAEFLIGWLRPMFFTGCV